jgi:hypothetical protein
VRGYEQAIDLAITERKRFAWLETACRTLSSLPANIPAHLIDQWAALRTVGTAEGAGSRNSPCPLPWEEGTATAGDSKRFP